MELMPHLLMIHKENGSLGYITHIEQGGEIVKFHQVLSPESYCMLPVHMLRGLDRLITPDEENAIQSNPLLVCRYELIAEMPEAKEPWLSWAARNIRSMIGLLTFFVFIIAMCFLILSKEVLCILASVLFLLFLGWCCLGFFDNGFSKRKRGHKHA